MGDAVEDAQAAWIEELEASHEALMQQNAELKEENAELARRLALFEQGTPVQVDPY